MEGKILEDEYFCDDITCSSSYTTLNECILYGPNRDSEKLPQLNLTMLFGQKSTLQAYCHRISGNATDVYTVHNLCVPWHMTTVLTIEDASILHH